MSSALEVPACVVANRFPTAAGCTFSDLAGSDAKRHLVPYYSVAADDLNQGVHKAWHRAGICNAPKVDLERGRVGLDELDACAVGDESELGEES